MSTIWAIEEGEYSDYHVVGVFTSKENAEKVLEKLKGEYNYPSLVEWPLDPAVAELNQGLSQYLVWMLKDGSVERVEQREFSSYDLAGEVIVWKRSKAPYFKGEKPDVLTATVWAADDKHSIKIVNEKRIQMLALEQWK
jgi:hypothetical protein